MFSHSYSHVDLFLAVLLVLRFLARCREAEDPLAVLVGGTCCAEAAAAAAAAAGLLEWLQDGSSVSTS